MGVEPVQIYVMSAIRGVDWAEAWRDRAMATVGRHDLAFLGRSTFIQNNRADGRPKDLADLDALATQEDPEAM